ncbi:MAG TPA: carboxypeptidase-like regulatory domain-containing protein [Chitinophagaceae bacterium]|nr:carboxypeptidase-like regulatory domain-containing protein [Chitinophagaceae bacterium]
MGLVLIPSFVFAQNEKKQNKKIIQLSGQIKHTDNVTPIPNVVIRVKNKDIGTYSNYQGVYSIAIQEDDTLIVSSLGLSKKEIVLEDLSNNIHNFEYRDIIMEQDTVYLNPVYISPLPSGKAFDYAFTQIDFSSPAHTYRRNLNPQSLQDAARTLPMTAQESQRSYQKQLMDNQAWDGLIRGGNLLQINGLFDALRPKEKKKDYEIRE